MNVEALNAAFPKYPITISDKGWVYGVWYCGTAWNKVKLHGQYPPSFLKRALALFPDAQYVLHCPSGTLTGPGITIDAIKDEVRCPQIIADASSLPLANNSLDLVLSDPPYTSEDSKKYGLPPFPLTKFINECHRTLKPGGHLAMLHAYIPSFRRKDWKLVGLIAVATGVYRMTRMFSILERLGEEMAPRTRRPIPPKPDSSTKTTVLPPKEISHNSEITDDALIAENFKIEEHIKAAQTKFNDWAAPHKTRLAEIEAEISRRLLERNAKNTKTDSGTAYFSDILNAKVETVESLFDYVADNWEMIGAEVKINLPVDLVRQHMESNEGRPPPGMSISFFKRLNIKRS